MRREIALLILRFAIDRSTGQQFNPIPASRAKHAANQTLHFANPVFAEELILARIEIEKIRKWRRGGVVVQCQTKALLVYDENNCTCTKDAVTGVANVWLPSGYQVSTKLKTR